MKNNKLLLVIALLISAGSVTAQSDSLQTYIRIAAENNPAVKSGFLEYQASLQKVPQAGAYPDMQLEMGFFLKPMELAGGNQIGSFKLMQMFPWFGTRTSARSEAVEMAKMSFEKFRDAKDNLVYSVKSEWYVLSSLKQKLRNAESNRLLLLQLKELALSKYAATPPKTGSQPAASLPVRKSDAAQISAPSGGMSGMGGAGGSTAPQQGSAKASMSGMGGGGSAMTAGGNMSDVLRTEIEISELDDLIASVKSQMESEEVKFNLLLNRAKDMQVAVPDSIIQVRFEYGKEDIRKAIVNRNPMLAMVNAEAGSYKAREEMQRRMSYPMFGVGLQYMLIGKREGMNAPAPSMNGKDMVMPMLQVSIPIFRKKYTSQQAESRLMQSAAEEKYSSTLNGIETELSQTMFQLEDAQRKVNLYDRQVALVTTTYNLVVREFVSGTGDLTNVIQVQRQLLDYMLKRSDAVAAYNTMVAGVERLMSEVYQPVN